MHINYKQNGHIIVEIEIDITSQLFCNENPPSAD